MTARMNPPKMVNAAGRERMPAMSAAMPSPFFGVATGGAP